MKIIVYTFKSFPYKATLRQCFPNYFEFGKLKQSLIAFQQIIDKQKPKYILQSRICTYETICHAKLWNTGKFRTTLPDMPGKRIHQEKQ